MIRIRYDRGNKTILSVVDNVIVDSEHSRLLFTSLGSECADIIIYFSSVDKMVKELFCMLEKGYGDLNSFFFTHVDDL